MTFELNIKCIRQHPATNNYLETTKRQSSETDQPIVITVNSFRQLQPGIWKVPINQGSQELINLLSALNDYSVFPTIYSTHPLARYIVEELLHHGQSLVTGDQATKPKQPKAESNSIQW